MSPETPSSAATVSNLVPVWDDASDGGSFAPRADARAVVQQAVLVEQVVPPQAPTPRPRLVAPPEEFDEATLPARRSAYELLDGDSESWAEQEGLGTEDELPQVDYDLLHRREIAKELLRARLVAIAERRERRSAYEIAFILLAAAVAVLLAAPPLVQVLLAAHGNQV
jgi:hypothetical protein